jgi:hypothetical protein
MTREVQGIPPAPRRVRWRAVLWSRWPLCLCALVLTVYGGVWDWMLFLAYGAKPSDNARLEEPSDFGEEKVRTEGAVTLVDQNAGFYDDLPADSVHFEFRWNGQDLRYECFSRPGIYAVGQRVEIELLANEPHICRIVGTRLHLLPKWLSPAAWFRWVVLPGFALLTLWFCLVLRLRRTMSRGDIAVAELDQVRRLRFVVPAMIAATYHFRDHHAAVRRGRHWVPLRSPLGMRLEVLRRRDEHCRMPVVHSRAQPDRNRLTIADDFVRSSAGTADLHTLIS